ncbi:MAG TPA: S26 family signal peptidase [Patescibacteria group bacterium]|nr:S26 family signal peptidase [Patescibacteria group bacterium]
MMRIKKLLTRCFDFVPIKRAIFLIKIEGESMWPVLIPRRQYLATNMLPIRRGDLAVFYNPQNKQEIFVKRISRISNGKYYMESMVSWGSSCRDFGCVIRKNILGKIL